MAVEIGGDVSTSNTNGVITWFAPTVSSPKELQPGYFVCGIVENNYIEGIYNGGDETLLINYTLASQVPLP